MSFPFFGEEFTFIQPDGTHIRVIGWGDQHDAVFETEDGYTVVKDASSGFFRYATLTPEGNGLRASALTVARSDPRTLGLPRNLRSSPSARSLDARGTGLLTPRWKERAEQRNRAMRGRALGGRVLRAPPARETAGDFTGLCLPIDFADAPRSIAREEIERFCNQVGYSGFGNHGSVFDYFADNSRGKLRYRTLVTPYYTASHPKAWYTDPGVQYGLRARDLVGEALTFHRERGVDFSSLSVDDQHGVFAMNVLYAGPVTNNWGDGLWPHASRLAAPLPLATGVNAVDYQITAMDQQLVLGTYCHENGHMLCDFPDLYEYSNQSRGIGKYCLMCLGGNADPRNPVNVAAYLRFRAGWADSVALASGLRVELAPGRLAVHARSATEYFLIENRAQQGRDLALPDAGLAVWHIDELGSNSEPTRAPAGHQHFECVLVQADGRSDLELGANPGDVSDLFASGPGPIFSAAGTPSSRWWDGSESKLQIRAVGFAGGRASFTVEL
jgi:M6 family metalloprotease-like protein